MEIEAYLKNNLILIIPNNLKNKIIKYLNSQKEFYDIKILTINELKKHLLFDFDTKTINYLMKENNLSMNNALELLNNMYYLLDEQYTNPKLNNLIILKQTLINNNLLILDPYFINYLKNKEILIYGFDYLNRYNLKLIDILKEHTKVTIINKNDNNYNHKVLNFDNLNDEIEFIANDIISKNLTLNNVYIYGINNDNESTLKRIFSNYNLNINLPSNNNLLETKIGTDFINNLSNIDEFLIAINNNDIKDLLIDILNKYYWATNKEDIKEMLIWQLKNTYIPNIKYQNSINITNLFDDYFTDTDYIYIINFNEEYIPTIYKDTDYINDIEKPDYLESTNEKNNIEKEKWNKVLSKIKNLTITSSNQNLNGSLKESPLVSLFNLETIKMDYKPSNYSNQSNIFNLAYLLDNYLKYGNINNHLSNLLTTYPNHKYLTYNNNYQKIALNKDFNYSLSYSKLNTYYECSFKYYCDYILNLNEYIDTFDTYLGSICHDILSKIYNDDFNFNIVKEEYLLNHPFNLTNENKVFLNKILTELEFAIKYLKSFNNITKYNDIETEKYIEININNIKFNGFIDKVMKYQDNLVLVDYKTGTPDIDLRLANYGLNLQLPTYIYLIKKIYPNSNIVGIYLQHILMPSINKDPNKALEEQYENNLKLTGYTLGNENILSDFDPTYENSKFIKGLKMTNDGFSKTSKVLTNDNFTKLEKLVSNKIEECITNIENREFNINPKIVNFNNISCPYCKYNKVCFKTEKNNTYLKLDNNLEFLGGSDDNLD